MPRFLKRGMDASAIKAADAQVRATVEDILAQIEARVHETGVSFVYVNRVGGQDELVFDGASFIMDDQGGVARTERRYRATEVAGIRGANFVEERGQARAAPAVGIVRLARRRFWQNGACFHARHGAGRAS